MSETKKKVLLGRAAAIQTVIDALWKDREKLRERQKEIESSVSALNSAIGLLEDTAEKYRRNAGGE